jgi:hypothetical protein
MKVNCVVREERIAPGTRILRPETKGRNCAFPRTETEIGQTEVKKPRQWRAFRRLRKMLK